MKRKFIISFIFLYTFGTVCLPQSNFLVLAKLPEMYRGCKANEDRDMTFIDFITDHLINIDSFFDNHLKGDKQKPHAPKQHHHLTSATCFFESIEPFKIANLYTDFFKLEISSYTNNRYTSDYYKSLFRPPIFLRSQSLKSI